VSDFCQTYDKERGYCTSCYKGYTINPYTGDCTIPKLWFSFFAFSITILTYILTQFHHLLK
jgi:hypothetical protein